MILRLHAPYVRTSQSNPLYEFVVNVTVNATLHSYENGVCTVCGKEDTTGIDEITSNVH